MVKKTDQYPEAKVTSAMNNRKICVSVLFVTVSLGIVIPFKTGKIYPFTNIIFTLGIFTVVLFSYNVNNPEQTYPIYILSIVALAVAYRLRIFFFPESMLGMDPDGYAVQITRVMISGDISTITYNSFYLKAPFHILEGAITGLVTNLPAPSASAIYPVLSGIATPLVATVFVKQLRPNSPRTMIIAAAGASLLGFSVRFSYWPISQTIGVLFVLFVIFSMFVYSLRGERRWLLLGLLMMLGAIYTHKLAAVTMAASICGAAVFGYLYQGTRNTLAVTRLMRGAVGLVTLLTIVQLFFITDFGKNALLRIAVRSPPSSMPEPTAAINPAMFKDRIFQSSYFILLGVLSGIVWFGWLWKTITGKMPKRDVLFLGFVAPTAGLTLIAPFAVAPPSRTVHYSEVLLFVVVVVGLYWTIMESSALSPRIYRYIAVGAVLLLTIAAGISPTVAPDYGSGSRDYLTTEEVKAKEWGYERVPYKIMTDKYFALETPPAIISNMDSVNQNKRKRFNGRQWMYLNNTFTENNPLVIAYRGCVDTLRSSSGTWRITYNPGKILNKEYNSIYDSGCVSYFSRSSSEKVH